MTINKFQGKTKDEAIEKAKKEYGPNAVIMNIREIKPKGFFRAFASSTYEVTAAMEEKEEQVSPLAALMRDKPKRPENINLAADEQLEIPQPSRYGSQSPLTSDYENRRGGLRTTAATREEQDRRGEVRTGNRREENTYGGRREESSYGGRREESAYVSREERSYGGRREESTYGSHEERSYGGRREERSYGGRRGESASPQRRDSNIEARLESLSSMIEARLGGVKPSGEPEKGASSPTSEELNFLRILYKTLVDNEVHERYVNQIMDEMERLVTPGKSVDTVLANVYQKLILRFGQPRTIEMDGKKPRVIFFVGPTGVGKTTTIAKIASRCKMDQNRKVAFITSDTYRIAATEQLRVYANILDAPMEIVYEVEELNNAVRKMAGFELIFVDTAGFSHKNGAQKEDIRRLIQGLDPAFPQEVYLVLSATTKYQDLMEIVDTYREVADYKLIFTKLDETTSYGNILNVRLYSNADLSYATIGQNVPDDLEVFDSQRIVKQLLGGK